MWKLNNTLLNDTLVKEEIKKEIKDFVDFNENEDTTYTNLLDTMKAVLKWKHIALSASKKKLERAYTSSLTAHLKALEQKEEICPRGETAENNQTQGWNQQIWKKKRTVQSQPNQEMVLWKKSTK